MPTCFVVMPVSTPPEAVERYAGDDDHFAHVYAHLFKPAIERAGYEALPPVARGSDIIHAEIIRKLETSDLVLCDMSLLNANVFFELGIRTALDRPVALTRDEYVDQVPFDTTLINHHEYTSGLTPWTLTAEIEALANHLTASAQGGPRNSLWRYFGLTTRAQMPEESTKDQKLDLILQAVSGVSQQRPAPVLFDRSDPLCSAKHVATLATQLGAFTNARLRVVAMEPQRLVLDLGAYLLSDREKNAIQEIGKAYRVTTTVTGSGTLPPTATAAPAVAPVPAAPAPEALLPKPSRDA